MRETREGLVGRSHGTTQKSCRSILPGTRLRPLRFFREASSTNVTGLLRGREVMMYSPMTGDQRVR